MRLIRLQRAERGDTIIEVLFAVTVFAMVAVGSLSIMNQGTATAQRALEITLVRQQIDAQAEAIRYIHQAYVTAYQKGSSVAPSGAAAEWVEMIEDKGVNRASDFGQGGGSICPDPIPAERPFILNARKATVANSAPFVSPAEDGSMPPFSQVIYNEDDSSIKRAYGLWIEVVPSTEAANEPGYVDFHIRACWGAAGSPVPMTLGTIVRLYEPR